MITCHIRYVIEPRKTREFERYAKSWIALVRKFGGIHHGYLLPSEGSSNIALAWFSFPPLSAYEDYRTRLFADAECLEATRYSEETGCHHSSERTFFRPVFD